MHCCCGHASTAASCTLLQCRQLLRSLMELCYRHLVIPACMCTDTGRSCWLKWFCGVLGDLHSDSRPPSALQLRNANTPVCLHRALCSGYLNTNVWEYKENLEAMIDKLKDKGVENILVLLPPPVRGSSAQSKVEVVSMAWQTYNS